MRACEQCGLSMGDSATFCAVCGARVDPASWTNVVTPEESVTQSSALSAPDGDTAAGGRAVGRDATAEDAPQDAASRRLRDAALPMHEAGDLEKADPERAVTLYRESILRFLEATADPLDHALVRHDLLVVFDRLSLVLKREGQPEEALEEIESAASLGLLDCEDHGIKGHREALKKRRGSLRRSLDGASPPPA